MLFVLSKRPFLGMLLAGGSPAVFPMRSFEYQDPIGILRERYGRIQPPKLSCRRQLVIMVLEYMVAMAAVANVVTLAYQLGILVSCTFAPHVSYLPLLWVVLNLAIHTSGATALYLRVRVKCQLPCNTPFEYLRIHFTPVSMQKPHTIEVVGETYWFILINWFTSILTVCHVLYGTLAFSSMLFISVKDSLPVIGRFMASVICCRIILMYELASLRDSFNSDSESELELLEVKRHNVGRKRSDPSSHDGARENPLEREYVRYNIAD